MMVKWTKVRRKGVVSIGEGVISDKPFLWNIRKSPAGVAYQLFLGETGKTPIITRATIEDCQKYAEEYL